MRYIGIDYGKKRVGVAVSDERGHFAMPREVLASDDQLVARIVDLAKENGVAAIVIGESKDFQGKDNPIMEGIRDFREKLSKATSVETILEPEFLTSLHAEDFQAKGELHDASAAALILQRFLDRNRKERDDDLGE